MEFQTRNEAGKLQFFSTLLEAYNAWKLDKTIWKISCFDDNYKSDRWRPKTKHFSDIWNEESERTIDNLCQEYKDEINPDIIYWIHQTLLGPHHDTIFLNTLLTIEEREIEHNIDCILECITTKQFLERYN